jgi:hypothetical protein
VVLALNETVCLCGICLYSVSCSQDSGICIIASVQIGSLSMYQLTGHIPILDRIGKYIIFYLH